MSRPHLSHAGSHRGNSSHDHQRVHGPGSASASGTLPRLREGTWILIVEDDDDIRRFFRGILEAEGYLVDEAASAEGGLELLRENDYDLILTDYTLPLHTGAWMLKKARMEGLLEGRALMLTGHQHPRSVPGVAIMRKPIDIETFLTRVRQTV